MILIVVLMGVGYLLVCPAFPVSSGRAFSAGGQAAVGSGGLYPMVLCHSASHALDQGQ